MIYYLMFVASSLPHTNVFMALANKASKVATTAHNFFSQYVPVYKRIYERLYYHFLEKNCDST